MRIYRRFGMQAALVWFFAVTVGQQAFAIDPTGASGETVREHSLAQFLATGLMTDASIPEPGIVALLGFGLVLVGLSYRRNGARANRTHHRTHRLQNMPFLDGKKEVQNSNLNST